MATKMKGLSKKNQKMKSKRDVGVEYSSDEDDLQNIKSKEMEYDTPETLDPENAGADKLTHQNIGEDEDKSHYLSINKSSIRKKLSKGALEDIIGDNNDEMMKKYSASKTTRRSMFKEEEEEEEDEEDSEDETQLNSLLNSSMKKMMSFDNISDDNEDEEGEEEEEEEEKELEDSEGGEDDEDDKEDEELDEDEDEDEDINKEMKKMAEEQQQLVSKLKKSNATDLEKSKSVSNQMNTIEQLLNVRIEFQKSLDVVSQLPLPKTIQVIENNSEYKDELEEAMLACQQSSFNLINSLSSFRINLIKNNDDISKNYKEESLDEIESFINEVKLDLKDEEMVKELKKSLYNEEYHNDESNILSVYHQDEIIDSLNKPFDSIKFDTISKWYNKVNAVANNSLNNNDKKFKAINQNTVKQIETILKDKERLRRKTQGVRTEKKIIGGLDFEKENKNNVIQKVNEDYYDDLDFYQNILKEMIDLKSRTGKQTDPKLITMKIEHLKSLQKQKKKVVDTRASKGRKIRYDVHEKIVNFMSPMNLTVDNKNIWHKEMIDELFKEIEINFSK